MRIRLAIPDAHVNADVLDAALEATTRAAASQMAAGDAPTFSDLLRSGVRWQPEHFTDGEHFDLPSVVGERGWGDCDDLAPTLAAELRARGHDTGARARVVPSGPDRWHAVVQLSDGTIVDPSRMAGMKGQGGVHGAIAKPMTKVGESALAIAPHNGEWFARTDVPWKHSHIASIAHDRDPVRAVDRSVVGALACGEHVAWSHCADRSVLSGLFEDVASGTLRKSIWTPSRYRHGPVIARF
jgi:hypothetical protein